MELKPKVKEFLDQTVGLYIDGEYVESATGKTFETLNPATEEVLTEVSEAQEEDIDQAVKAAEKAFNDGSWSNLTTAERSHLMYKFADLLEENREELAQLDTLDNGKPYQTALEDDIDGVVDLFQIGRAEERSVGKCSRD